jgi:aspartate oxidase
MWSHAGLVRSGPGLETGIRELDALERDHGGTDLRAPLTVARLMLTGALEDRRSLGCHYRSDAESSEEARVADLPG